MGLDFTPTIGKTGLSKEEKAGLLIPTVTTKRELDEYEQQHIEEAIQWLFTSKFKTETILTEEFSLNLHKRMYGGIWTWAGKFRRTNGYLGIEYCQIPTALNVLLNETSSWIKNETFSPDEIAIRFKHRIVSIHCFDKGNGRHSRLMADIIVEKIYRRPAFSWGAENLMARQDLRSLYLASVKEADRGNITPLINFARS